MPLARRLPKRGFKSRNRLDFATVNLGNLASLEAGAVVDLAFLRERGLVRKGPSLLKVLGGGDLALKLTVRAHKFSATAAEKITQAGGTVEVLEV
jgi:large subunit ribosomal protein L15